MKRTAASSRPFVSVVVCTLNGAGHIAETLAALQGQTFPHDRYEVIVIDDGSTDDTAAIVAGFPVRLVQHDGNKGLGVARNSGLAAARGDIIAYTDDDCLPVPVWLEQLVRPYADPSVVAAGGRVFAVSEETPTERYMDVSGYGNPAPYGISGGGSILGRLLTYMRQMAAPLHLRVQDGQSLQEIYTLNASYRVAQLRAIGGFDVRLRAAEDSDVSARLYAADPGSRIVFAAGARVGHRHRRRLWPWVRQTFERSQDAFVQIRKEGRIPPVFPFPVAVVAAGGLALALGPFIGLATLAMAPLAFYWWWQLRLMKRPLLDRIRFPYMQFCLESATLLGYGVAAWRRRRAV